MMSSDKAGQLVHANIPSLDLERSQEFYGKVFGWEFTPNTDSYVLFSDRGGIGGGLTTAAKPSRDGVLLFIHVDDIPDALVSIEEAGGVVELGKTPVSGPGFYAVFVDSEGNRMGLYSKS